MPGSINIEIKKTRGGKRVRSRFRRREHRRTKDWGAQNTPTSKQFEDSGLVSEAKQELTMLRERLPKPNVAPGYVRIDGQRRRALYIKAPAIFSIENNREEFLGLIADYQWRMWAQAEWQKGKSKSFVIDLSTVTDLTLDAALVTTAEYDRLLLLNPSMKAAIVDDEWRDEVRSLFEELGLQKLVGARHRTGKRSPNRPKMRFIPFVSGKRVEQRHARSLIDKLREVAGREPEREYIFAALVEAIQNVRQHAYPADAAPSAVERVGKWWAAGAYDPDHETLQFVVYDQGVGIPATLPRQGFWSSISRLCPLEFNDADIIAGGIRYGRTRIRSSDSPSNDAPNLPNGRGNGLWSICQFIPKGNGSSVRIISGRGEVTYSGGKTIARRVFETPFCGTLIQWNIRLPPTNGATK